MARQLGISLLDSYVVIGDRSLPESLCDPAEVYQLMRQGTKVSTAQAGNFERYQHFRSICRQYGPSLYLTVGSFFTGNHGAACAWRESDPLGGLLTVLDSGAASGRLAAIAIAVARRAPCCSSAEEVLATARLMLDRCQEWVFINELKYLVAGGRVSKASGFFGDLLTMKPVITPTADGVKKLGVVRSRQAQVRFAIDRLQQQWHEDATPLLILQYSDNQEWLEEQLEPQLRRLLPAAEILVVPLSLTSGVHMGPGTWSLAVAPPLGE
jgi:DegV family protein with EDD domain